MESGTNQKLSARLAAIVEALPLHAGVRVLEIGCGSGAMARAMVSRIGDGHVLAIDRSAKAIQQAKDTSQSEIESGHLSLRQVAIENLALDTDEQPYEIAVAIRVGALDGRHPEIEERALRCIARSLLPEGRLFIDGGNPLREISLEKYR